MGNTKISPEERRVRVLREMKRPSWGDKEDNSGFHNARASKYRALFIKKETRKRFDEHVDGASLKHSIRSKAFYKKYENKKEQRIRAQPRK